MTAPIDRLMDAVEWEVMPPREPNPDGVPHVTHSGILDLAGFQFRVFQLSSGQRVLDAGDVEKFFGGAGRNDGHGGAEA